MLIVVAEPYPARVNDEVRNLWPAHVFSAFGPLRKVFSLKPLQGSSLRLFGDTFELERLLSGPSDDH